MKKAIIKQCVMGVIIGVIELLVALVISEILQMAIFEDVSFCFGIATLLFGLLIFFGGKRLHSVMSISPFNSVAEMVFLSEIAIQETKLKKNITEKAAPFHMSFVRVLGILLAAVIVLVGFSIDAFLM